MAFTEKKKLLELSPDKIVPNPAQPRLDFPQDELLQLAEAFVKTAFAADSCAQRPRPLHFGGRGAPLACFAYGGAQNHPGHCAGAFSAGRRGVGAY